MSFISEQQSQSQSLQQAYTSHPLWDDAKSKLSPLQCSLSYILSKLGRELSVKDDFCFIQNHLCSILFHEKITFVADKFIYDFLTNLSESQKSLNELEFRIPLEFAIAAADGNVEIQLLVREIANKFINRELEMNKRLSEYTEYGPMDYFILCLGKAIAFSSLNKIELGLGDLDESSIERIIFSDFLNHRLQDEDASNMNERVFNVTFFKGFFNNFVSLISGYNPHQPELVKNSYKGDTFEAFKLFLDCQFRCYYSETTAQGQQNSYFSPYFPIIQSSGMGKTRLIFELATNPTSCSIYKTVYFCIRSKADVYGSPARMNTISDLVLSLEGEREWVVFLISVIQSFLDEPEYDIFNRKMDEDVGAKCFSLYSSLHQKVVLIGESSKIDISNLNALNEFTSMFEKEFSTIKSLMDTKKKLVLVIDEITSIFLASPDPILRAASFLSFRKGLIIVSEALRMGEDGVQVMSIVLDTNSSITNLSPKVVNEGGENALTGDFLLNPYICMATFGVLRFAEMVVEDHRFIYNQYPLQIQSPQGISENPFSIPFNPFPLIDCGRPIFTRIAMDILQTVQIDPGNFGRVLTEVQNAVLLYAKAKLLKRDLTFDCESSCALICSRIGISIYAHDLADYMVKSMLGTCRYINEPMKLIDTFYRTEPVVAEASAFVLQNNYSQHIRNFCSVYLNSFSRDKGIVGETIVAILLLKAIDSSVIKTYPNVYNIDLPIFLFARPVTTRSFLKELFDIDLLLKIKDSPLDADFFSSLIQANNVAFAEDKFSSVSLESMVEYASVVWGIKNQTAFDFAIPFTSPSHFSSSIFVQVKIFVNLSKNTVNACIERAAKDIVGLVPKRKSTIFLIINMGYVSPTISTVSTFEDNSGLRHCVVVLSPYHNNQRSSINFFPCCDHDSMHEFLKLSSHCVGSAEQTFASVVESPQWFFKHNSFLFKELNKHWSEKTFVRRRWNLLNGGGSGDDGDGDDDKKKRPRRKRRNIA